VIQNEFCNTIGTFRTQSDVRPESAALKRTLVERVYELEREGAGREDMPTVARFHLPCPAPGQRAALVRALGLAAGPILGRGANACSPCPGSYNPPSKKQRARCIQSNNRCALLTSNGMLPHLIERPRGSAKQT
jgi:hypothetical protein